MWDGTRDRAVSLSLFICFLLHLGTTPPAYAQRAILRDEQAAELADYLWSGWAAERQKLRAAEVLIQGEEVGYKPIKVAQGKYEPDEVKYRVDVDVRLLANWDAGYRVHKIYWGELYKGIWLSAPDKVASWPDKGGGVLVIKDPAAKRMPFAIDIDPRVVGYASGTAIQRSISFETVVAAVQNLPQPESVSEVAEGQFQIVYDSAYRNMRKRDSVVINESEGFTVVSREIDYYQDDKDRRAPVNRTKVKWQSKSGVWVPIWMECYEPQALQLVTLNFKWTSLNQSIPVERFALGNLGIPKGTLVTDSRLDPANPIVLGKIGESGFRSGQVPPASNLPKLRTSTYILLAANGIVLLALLAGWFVLRRRQRRDAEAKA